MTGRELTELQSSEVCNSDTHEVVGVIAAQRDARGGAVGLPESGSLVLPESQTSELCKLQSPLPHDRNPALVYLARLAGETSATTMGRVLRRVGATLARWTGEPEGTPFHRLPWHALRYQHVAALRAQWIQAGLKPRTIHQYLAAVRGVLDEAENLGLLSPNDARLARKVRGPKIPREDLAGRAVTDEEVRALAAACDPTTATGLRDLALVALLFGGGLRRREAARVRVEDVDLARGEVRVRGKGAKARTVPLAVDAMAAVAALRAQHPGRGAAGPLLYAFELSGDGGARRDARGALTGLSPSGVWSVLAAVAARAGVTSLTPHDARRTRITKLLLRGESIALVQRIAGHESVETTGRYVRTDAENARAAAQRVSMVD